VIRDQDKPDILNKGEWRAHNPNAPADLRSYQISSLYSLSLTFGAIARLFLAAKGDRSRLQNFHNSILGKAWTPTQATVSEQAIDKLIEKSPKYNKGEIPGKVKALILGADTQQADIYYGILALLEDGGSALIDYGIVVSFEDLGKLLDAQFKIKGTGDYIGLYGGIIDAGGNRTSQVYDACLTLGGRLVPSFGRTEKHKLFTPIRASTIVYKGYNLPILNINDKIFTDLLLLNVFRSGSETLYLPQDSDQILKDQLTAVSIVEKKDAKGFLTYEYQSRRDNHLFDTLKLAYALRYYLLPQLNQVVEETPREEEVKEEYQPETNMWN
jgi:hypothetical protein